MVRSSQATTFTFSSSPYFDDRGPHGYAEPITERVNVRYASRKPVCKTANTPLLASFAPGRFVLLPKRRRCTALWGKLDILKLSYERCLVNAYYAGTPSDEATSTYTDERAGPRLRSGQTNTQYL